MDIGMDHSATWELVERVSKFRSILVLSIVTRLSVCMVLQLHAAKGIHFSGIMNFICRHVIGFFGRGTKPLREFCLYRLTESQAYIPTSSRIPTRDPSVHALGYTLPHCNYRS
jgi:hypothetical protein